MKIQIVQDLEKDDFHRIAATIYGKGFIKLFAECVDLDPAPLIADYLRSVEGDAPSLIAKDADNQRGIYRPQPLPEPDNKETEAPLPETHLFEFEEQGIEAPQTEPDAEDDLFAYTKKKNTIEDESVISPETEPKTVASEKKGKLIIERIRLYLTNTFATIRNHILNFANKLADIQWGDAPIKVISIMIGLMIIILVLAISINSCSNKPDATPATEDNTLKTSAPPPEPYFD